MKIHIICATMIACTNMAIMSMFNPGPFNPDPNAATRQRWAEIDRQLQEQQLREQNERRRREVSAGNFAVARQHNQNLQQFGK